MAKSMTGYGRAEEILNGRDITVELKSVNARYFEYTARLPRSLNFLDDSLKKTVSAAVARGKLEVHLSIQTLEAADTQVSVNLDVAQGYYDALFEMGHKLKLENDVKVSSLARFPDVFTLKRAESNEDALRADVLQVLQQALARFDEMRENEGSKLCADIMGRLDVLEQMLNEVEKDSAGRIKRYTEKLQERLRELLADRNIDDSRVLTEAAIFADKTAVDEETVRLRSHLKQFREILSQQGPVGRKLDFLTQEVNRETNTIGSKCQELEITRLVVNMKAEVEKIREQIQNLE